VRALLESNSQLNIAIETLLGLTSKAHAAHMSALSAVVIEDEAQDEEAVGPPGSDGTGARSPDLRRAASKAAMEAAQPGGVPRYKYLRVVTRTVITCLCTLTAILLPGFGKVMAFLGSFSAFLICIILPVSRG
jgi:vesicular inhibitory amino acid transporter